MKNGSRAAARPGRNRRVAAIAAVSHETSQDLRDLAARFKGKRILLVGDVLADHYIFGKTARISREAPVLILKYQEERTVPGQAANTACNVAALGGKVKLLGVVGKDLANASLKKALRGCGVPTDSLMESSAFSTLTKTRILAGGHHTARQQVIRIDDDDRMSIGDDVRKRIATAIARLGAEADALVVSDYGYGLIDENVWAAALEVKRQRGVPLVLDSRYQFLALRGATLITPNEEEAVEACGLTTHDKYDIEQVGRKLLRATAAETVLVTRGNEGMALFRPRAVTRHIGISGTDQCTDVTGAGDTVVAAVALALAAGGTPEEAANIANAAAGVVVMKMGTATVSPHELLAALQQ